MSRPPNPGVTFRTRLMTPARQLTRLLLPAIVVGAGSGLGAVGFR